MFRVIQILVNKNSVLDLFFKCQKPKPTFVNISVSCKDRGSGPSLSGYFLFVASRGRQKVSNLRWSWLTAPKDEVSLSGIKRYLIICPEDNTMLQRWGQLFYCSYTCLQFSQTGVFLSKLLFRPWKQSRHRSRRKETDKGQLMPSLTEHELLYHIK